MNASPVSVGRPLSAFVLVEHERKPMRGRGRLFVPATVVPLDLGLLRPGRHRSVSSDSIVNVESVGLLADAVPEAKRLYALSRVVAITLDEASKNALDGAVYVAEAESRANQVILTRGRRVGSGEWDQSQMGLWIPGIVRAPSAVFEALGWFRVLQNDRVELATFEFPTSSDVTVHARYDPDVVCHVVQVAAIEPPTS